MLKRPENISYEQVKEAIASLPLNEQALPALAYATGSRVSELNHIKKKDFHQTETYLEIYCPVLKKRDNIKHERKAVVRLDETWLTTPILNYIKNLSPEETLFPLHRATIFRKLKQIKIGNEYVNPHGYRKLRATHLHLYFGFDAYRLKSFFEWKDISPSSSYVGIDKREILYGVAFGLPFLAVRTGDFFMDIVFPGIAGGAVILLIIMSLLKHWGFEFGL
jgi:site-specific recombinase XerD